MVDMSPSAIAERFESVSGDLHAADRLRYKLDMSPRAVAARFEQVGALHELSMWLAAAKQNRE